jgi:hypothetical protein
MAPEIIETPTHRIVGKHVFIKHTEKGTPPPELVAEVEEENAAADRAALTTPFEHPIATMQRDMQETQNFDALLAPFEGTIWIEKSPLPNAEQLKFEMKNFFRGIRPNVTGEAVARDQFVIRVACIPFYEHLPEPPKVETRGGRRRVFEVPTNTKATRETFPLGFWTLSEFLAKHRPETKMDVTILETIAAPDIGYERIEWIEPERVPTMPELMQALAAALKPKPATP